MLLVGDVCTPLAARLGLGVLFGKLQQGVQENEQILMVARMRADAEDLYGQKLGDIEAATNRIDGGFQRDDGASVKKVSVACGSTACGMSIC